MDTQEDRIFASQFDKEGLYTVPNFGKKYYYTPTGTTVGFTILHKWVLLANKYPHVVDIVEKYLQFCGNRGSPINKPATNGWTPLMLAAVNCSTVSSEKMVRILLHYGADLEKKACNEDVLFYMVRNKCSFKHSATKAVFRLLVTMGADINKLLYNGVSLLQYICYIGNVDALKLCIDLGADINIVGYNYKLTPLHKACEYNQLECVKVLIDSGANLNLKNSIGRTPLIVAVQNQYEVCAQLLIDSGADLNIQDQNGHTVLIFACSNNLINCVKELIKKGGNIFLKNKEGRDAYSYSRLQIRQILLGAGYVPMKTFNEIKKMMDNDYDKVIDYLKIKKINEKSKEECIVCYEQHDKMVILPCEHLCCLEEIINNQYYISASSKIDKKLKCFYRCEPHYTLDQCKLMTTI